MDEMDDLLDSLMQKKNTPKPSYVDDRYLGTFEVKDVPSKGDGMFAKKSVSVNDPICSLSYPTMMAIDSDFLPTTCYHCLIVTESPLPLARSGHTPMALKTCNGCHVARYCSRDCQVKSWHAYHKYECKIFKKVRDNLPPAVLRAVMRAILLKDRGVMPEEEWNRVIALTSNDHILASKGRSNLTDMAVGVQHLTESKLSFETIQRLVFIMKFNLIELPTPIYGGIGIMLDPVIAKFNHSCQPNVAIHRPQYTMTSGWMNCSTLSEEEKKTFMQIIPLRDIEAGEELLNCYVVPTVSVSARKSKLREDYFFDCDCPKCQADTQAIESLVQEQPNLPGEFEQWTKNVVRHLSQVNRNPDALYKAAANMDKIERFLDKPVLYTTGDFPQVAMGIILESLKTQAFDEALMNALRIYFLVNPLRFVGRHNPTNVYTIFLVLDILGILINDSPPNGLAEEKIDKSLQNLKTRGLSKNSLIYWQDRISADLRKRIEGSASTDLLVLVKKRDSEGDNALPGKDAEQEMSNALGIKEPVWTTVLEETGC